MIHFSARVQKSRVIALPCGMTADIDQATAWFERQIGLSHDNRLWTPAEEQVWSNFRDWAFEIIGKTDTWHMKNPAFIYANLNTGENLVVIAWCGYEDFGVSTQMLDS